MWPFEKSKQDTAIDVLRYRLKNRNNIIEDLIREKVELQKKMSVCCRKCKLKMRGMKL
jgi:hypothetical protein